MGRIDRLEKLLRAAVTRPIHLTVNITQGNVSTSITPPVEGEVADEEMNVVAGGAIGFRVDGNAEPHIPDEAE